jgi:hypothetical protein
MKTNTGGFIIEYPAKEKTLAFQCLQGKESIPFGITEAEIVVNIIFCGPVIAGGARYSNAKHLFSSILRLYK